jgi:hypothetical protein
MEEDYIYLGHGIKKTDSIKTFNNIIKSNCVKSNNFLSINCDYTKKNRIEIFNDKKLLENEYDPNLYRYVYTNLITSLNYYIYNNIQRNVYDILLIFKIPFSYIKDKYNNNLNLFNQTIWKDRYCNENKFPLTLFTNSNVLIFSDYIPLEFLNSVIVINPTIYDQVDYSNKKLISKIDFPNIFKEYDEKYIQDIYKTNPNILDLQKSIIPEDIQKGINTQLENLVIKDIINNLTNYCGYKLKYKLENYS